jgi:hypothetical protein
MRRNVGKGARFVWPEDIDVQVARAIRDNGLTGEMTAAADYMGPGAIEINRYQTEITDMVRRRLPLGQRIEQTPATAQPSRFFEQLYIPTAAFSDPRILQATASQPGRVERVVSLKALTAQINYGLFDVEVNQQQGQFAYLEAKDLTDTVDGTLKLHDQNLWQGNDTDLLVSTSTQYYGISGQIFSANPQASYSPSTSTTNVPIVVAATGSLVNAIKTKVAQIANRTDYETRPSAFYQPPLLGDLVDQEAKAFQLYFNQVEILPGVTVQGLPTQMGILPFVNDPAITIWPYGSLNIYTGFILSEEMIEYHYLTDPLPRVFQLGLLGSLSAQYVIVKFGGVVVKGAPYAHSYILTTR